jgi:ATP-dependent exoDNAse (exonuclease V) beta subunit
MDFEILERLNRFSNVKFEEKRHIYTIGDTQLKSTTTLIKEFEPLKDWNEIARRYALKNGESAQYWAELWRQEGVIASEKGTQLHLYAENKLANKVYEFDWLALELINKECDLIELDTEKTMNKLKLMFDVFWFQARANLVPVRSEFVVGDEELGIGGMVDQLFWNTKMSELQIWDWKTNKKIATSNKYQRFTGALSHLEECEFNKYSLQLSIYKYIIKKNLGLEVKNCYIGHFNEKNDTYKILKTKDLHKEVELILQ